MGKRFILALLAAATAGAVLGAGTMFAVWLKPAGAPSIVANPSWTEVTWPFPIDQWGPGKAYHCAAADCGSDVGLYVRAKIGFCNCTTGVADDEELERVADLELIAAGKTPIGPGKSITVGPMKGRSRGYVTAAAASPSASSVLAIAYNERCDVIVATVAMAHDRPAAIEQFAMAFLNGDAVMQWAALKLGL
jgi:hypothetical protein